MISRRADRPVRESSASESSDSSGLPGSSGPGLRYGTAPEAAYAAKRQFGNPGGWKETIRDMWARNFKIAWDNNVTLTPQQCAEMLVDINFAD